MGSRDVSVDTNCNVFTLSGYSYEGSDEKTYGVLSLIKE